MSTPDPYAALELPITATAEQIRVRHRQLALTHHPDRPTGNEEKFKAIQAAYELLIDPARKQAYDATQRLNREMEEQARRARAAGAAANESARRANEEQERILRERMREEENRRKREERAAREREELERIMREQTRQREERRQAEEREERERARRKGQTRRPEEERAEAGGWGQPGRDRAREHGHTSYNTFNNDPPPPYTPQPNPQHQAASEGTPLFPKAPQHAAKYSQSFAIAWILNSLSRLGNFLVAAAATLAIMMLGLVLAYGAFILLLWAAVAIVNLVSWLIPVIANVLFWTMNTTYNILFWIVNTFCLAIYWILRALGSIISILAWIFSFPGRIHWPARPAPYERNIAVVGVDPAGITTAYELFRLCSAGNIPHRITLYDQASHIGGRAVHIVSITPSEQVVLGANTFPKGASLLSSAAAFLGLSTDNSFNGGIDLIGSGTGQFGNYDGRSWSYNEPTLHNIFERWGWELGLNMRYGGSQAKAQDLIREFRGKLQKLEFPVTVHTLNTAGLLDLTAKTAEDFLTTNGVTESVQRELFDPWVRAQYAQNLGTISALSALAAANNRGTLKITRPEGMAGLWERMLAATDAKVQLKTRILNITAESWGGWSLSTSTETKKYDAVILAAPWGLTDLTISPSLLKPPQKIAYTAEHTTLFASAAELSPDAFSGQRDIPKVIMTTPCSWEYYETAGKSGVDGLGHAPFWSLHLLKQVVINGERMWLYQVSSPAELPDQELRRFVGGKEIGFVYRHYSPNAHPLLVPRTKFSDVLLGENLWYAGGMEEVLAGVEMASVMGKSVAEMVFKQWKSEGKFLPKERRIPVDAPAEEK
ncbi:hypothetical protein FN846DRAFT_965178 [Sphaerosporella brunnea]|uniref:J domain-containing protein n=1 Tax=Sphaerosporella brunnea TaxID=1250544 RepID=A0A5J5ENQ2_9PEZI|nr:hypothetical protein FN846DRAFT_965178 [Sphaerosporella brunnea]